MHICTGAVVTVTKINSYNHYSSAVAIGFNPTTYSVSEDVGTVSVAVSLLSGILDRDVIVSLWTINGLAVGKSFNKLSKLI